MTTSPDAPRRLGGVRRLALVVGSGLLAGCGGGPRLVPVKGTVTFDGKPVPTGDVTFYPADPTQAPQQGAIRDGRYEFSAHPGTNKVTVSASRIRPGGAKGPNGEPVPEEYLPDAYNVKSELTAEVTPGGPNEFPFDLVGKPK